jgi:NADH:ubiquinone oxidoreductase subunit 3 (subunit A)
MLCTYPWAVVVANIGATRWGNVLFLGALLVAAAWACAKGRALWWD